MDADFVKKGTISPKAGGVRVLDAVDSLILRGWRLFISLKFGIFLLGCIGAAAIYGTMGFAANPSLGDNAITMARGHFFETKGFALLLVLFALNIIFSTWHVTKMSFGIFWKRDFQREPLFYRGGKTPRAEVVVPGGIDHVRKVVRRRFTRSHFESDAVFAHKGILSRLGPTIVHIGMLTLITAVVMKSVLLWMGKIVTEGRFVAAEGEISNVFSQPIDLSQQMTQANRRETEIPQQVKILDFDEIKHPNSDIPAYFSSLVEIRDPETNKITVAQLDMNHYLAVGDLKFHQASFFETPDTESSRVNFDVRDSNGERIAVTDASVGTRVRVGDEDLFLEVDGVDPAARWRLYNASAPLTPLASGLLVSGRPMTFSFLAEEFFPDFYIDAEKKTPINRSSQPVNPALRLGVFLDGKKVQEQWLFIHPELKSKVPDVHPRYRLELTDVRLLEGVDIAKVTNWNEPGIIKFLVDVTDKTDGKHEQQELSIGEASRTWTYTSQVDHNAAPLGTEGGYTVRVLGPTKKFATVLSVVTEPTVIYMNLGVAIIVLGAMMTFVFRYRALYGLWDESSKTLKLAIVPRWGQSPVQQEFDEILTELAGKDGVVRRLGAGARERDEIRPAHATTA